jgi:hypothetical protein
MNRALKGVTNMASDDIQFLVGKILSDPDFAQALVENPEKVLQENGIEPSIDLLKALDGVDAESLKNLAGAFDDNQAAL